MKKFFHMIFRENIGQVLFTNVDGDNITFLLKGETTNRVVELTLSSKKENYSFAKIPEMFRNEKSKYKYFNYQVAKKLDYDISEVVGRFSLNKLRSRDSLESSSIIKAEFLENYRILKVTYSDLTVDFFVNYFPHLSRSENKILAVEIDSFNRYQCLEDETLLVSNIKELQKTAEQLYFNELKNALVEDPQVFTNFDKLLTFIVTNNKKNSSKVTFQKVLGVTEFLGEKFAVIKIGIKKHEKQVKEGVKTDGTTFKQQAEN